MKMNKKGFTLIEMLVVIAIIAILVAIIIPTVNGATTKAKEAADVANIRSEIAQYQIKTLEDPDEAFDYAGIKSKLNFSDKFVESETEENTYIYNASVLENNGSKEYSWTVGALYTDETTAS